MKPEDLKESEATPGTVGLAACTFLKHSCRISLTLRLVVAALFLSLGTLSVRALPEGFSETQVVVGLASPTTMAFAPDGRLFICLQGGQVRVVKDGILLSNPFVTVNVDPNGERGLLGIAFDPDFSNNHFVYLYYTTAEAPQHNRISRFTADGDVADPESETLIFRLDDLDEALIHNSGAMHFGADGKLYVSVGENNQPLSAQSLNSLLGKILRLNPDGSIPSDNPFYDVTMGNRRAIWALGFRNPFTFAFQPGSDRLFINDVGEAQWEEIDEGIAGANYGWPDSEGPTTNPNYSGPLFYYAHDGAAITGCAITGGAFYNPQVAQFPAEYVGKYFFADFCNGWIKELDPADGTVRDFAADISFPVNLQVGADGCLYYLARGAGGFVAKIQFLQNAAPTITTQPNGQTVMVGSPVTFTVVAIGGEPLAFQWLRDGVEIPGATSSSYTLATTSLSDSGVKFRARVSNDSGTALSQEATLVVTANRAPLPTITSPEEGTVYRAGDTISYSGDAIDPEDGPLGANAFTWKVDFHHNTHAHPFIPETSGSKSGSFVIPTAGETSSNVWYRIYLTVKDAGGMTQTTFRDVTPRKAEITVTTSMPGLQVTVDGQPHASPFTFTGVVGIRRTVGLVSPQTFNGVTYVFSSWSDGGEAAHEIITPDYDLKYTADFDPLPTPATFQFTQSDFQVPEDGHKITITVTRAGDLSTPAAVDYATADGTATERADYITALGTLQFAAGESSKVIDLLVTDDGLMEGNEDFHVGLSNPDGGPLLGTPSTATIVIKENETAPSSDNPIDDAQTFVRQQYHDFLNREPDAAGLQFWTNEIASCGPDSACRETKRTNVSAAFFLSIEFQWTGFLVHLLYGTGLGRVPTYREFLRDTQQIGNGVVVNTDGWDELARANQQAFVEQFVHRADFLARYPDDLTAEQYVDRLTADNGQTLSSFERDFLVAQMQAGALTRAQFLRQIAENFESWQREFKRSFVLMQYFGYLRRDPSDLPDGDWSGYNFWLGKLTEFNGDFAHAEMVKAFLLSQEYRQRFGPP